jgi:hypothetical protein
VPPDGATNADPHLDLMFLQAFGQQSYEVLLGAHPQAGIPGGLRTVGVLHGGNNVQNVSAEIVASILHELGAATVQGGEQIGSGTRVGLPPSSKWWWQVNTLVDSTVTGAKIEGELWRFTVRGSPTPPSPTPAPAPPGPVPPGPTPGPAQTCTACEQMYCPGMQGGGSECEGCVEANQRAFLTAGCYAKGARHAFLTEWCGSTFQF